MFSGRLENIYDASTPCLRKLSKVIRVGGNLTKFDKNNFANFFLDTTYMTQSVE